MSCVVKTSGDLTATLLVNFTTTLRGVILATRIALVVITRQKIHRKKVMNWDQIEGNWKQFTGKLKEKWGDLTDDELDQIAGNREQLEGKLQEKYGKSKEEAKKEVDDMVSSL